MTSISIEEIFRGNSPNSSVQNGMKPHPNFDINKHFYQSILSYELQRRMSKNSRYSLRAFARDLNMSPTLLSLVLRLQRGLSVKKLDQIFKVIPLSELDQKLFELSVLFQHARSSKEKDNAKKQIGSLLTEKNIKQLELENYKMAFDWEHLAILSLTKVKDFKSDMKWIAERLSLPEKNIEKAVLRLIKFGLLEITLDNKFQMGHQNIIISQKGDYKYLKNMHAQVLKRAQMSLQETPIDQTSFSSMIFCINKEQFAYAKEEVKKFRRRLMEEIQLESKTAERVYCMSVQLFPLDMPAAEESLDPQKTTE